MRNYIPKGQRSEKTHEEVKRIESCRVKPSEGEGEQPVKAHVKCLSSEPVNEKVKGERTTKAHVEVLVNL
jgi:hypothetical protein